jgi:hypothetical protein
MALINCSECDRQISDKSDACVGCGAPPDIFIRRTPTLIEITETKETSLEEIKLLNNNSDIPDSNVINPDNPTDSIVSDVNETQAINRYKEVLSNNDQLYQEEIKQFNPGPIESDAISEPSIDSSDTNNVEIEFDKADPRYKIYKITNTVLLVVLAFVDAGYAASQGMRANVFASFVTFMISRYVIRYYFAKRTDFRDGSDMFKIGASLIIWFIVFILKTIIGLIILNVAL